MQTRIISPYYALDRALRIKARDIVMAGLNARGLHSKLLITPHSSEAIIIITSRNAKHCGASLSDERVTI